ncbi:ATP-binding protein [Roseibium alexandrii]|uniref:ATP-binding protein n=1 Tax=Roseibium alexandrii TaxID=388408 RepID=UPI0037503665
MKETTNTTSKVHVDEFDEDTSDFFDDLRSQLPKGDQDNIQRLENAKNTYVHLGWDNYLEHQLRRLLMHILSKKNGKPDDGRLLFVTGESGAGKTESIRHLLDNTDALKPQQKSYGITRPAISISLKGPETLRTLGRTILEVAGYPVSHRVAQSEVWDMLPDQLRRRRVFLIHIDETQHLLKQTAADRERKNLASALKGLMNDTKWPVSFILSGLPRTVELASLDEQFERRALFAQRPSIEIPEDRETVVKIISELAAAAALGSEEAISGDLPDRIAHAANYRHGRIASLLHAVIDIALEEGNNTLVSEHFIQAYVERSHAYGDDDKNPFCADDWYRLDPGSFIYDRGITFDR